MAMAATSAEQSAPNAAVSKGALGPNTYPSMALIPASAPTATALSTTVASANSSMQAGIPEAEEAWPFVTKALMVATMTSQPPATAASTLLAVFSPFVQGWGATRTESKRWKERAEAYISEHRKHKTELAHKLDTLHAQSQTLQRSLAEREAKVRELESHHSTLRSSASSLEKKLAEAEAAAHAAKQAHAVEAQEREKQAEAMTKSAQEAKATYEKLSQEADKRAKAQTLEISNLLDKIKEDELVKAKLEERLSSLMASLEEQVAQTIQQATTLQTRFAELNTRNEALERQLASYRRMSTRRF
ncbi:hypothetical protein GOP47_0022885 [Adiantum capillus-veneris]|uniref:Uncharacterized protein n=1 Tax=Adiantum capillus-veneris TaxID=13818 RepID=A0A9D4U6A2_ADICA|nr:hypothetical protein GOP47_0022885 [Adiantum capillus-veneris]